MQEKRARAIAQWLENTGLYARVAVERVGAIRPAAAVGVGNALDVMDADATSAN